jgi:hypothetical protein
MIFSRSFWRSKYSQERDWRPVAGLKNGKGGCDKV